MAGRHGTFAVTAKLSFKTYPRFPSFSRSIIRNFTLCTNRDTFPESSDKTIWHGQLVGKGPSVVH